MKTFDYIPAGAFRLLVATGGLCLIAAPAMAQRIPEPASINLLGAGIAGLALLRRIRRD